MYVCTIRYGAEMQMAYVKKPTVHRTKRKRKFTKKNELKID